MRKSDLATATRAFGLGVLTLANAVNPPIPRNPPIFTMGIQVPHADSTLTGDLLPIRRDRPPQVRFDFALLDFVTIPVSLALPLFY